MAEKLKPKHISDIEASNTGHTWIAGENGNMVMFYYNPCDIESPKCFVCGYTFCAICGEKYMKTCGEVIAEKQTKKGVKDE